MAGFPFPTADKRYRIVFALEDGMFECEKNADGPNHALERAQRHLIRERFEGQQPIGGSIDLLSMELIEGTVPD
jgi:hypothetical protein